MHIPQEWLDSTEYYTFDDVDKVLNRIKHLCSFTETKIPTLNIPISFDIETSSFIDNNGEKSAIMYIWMIGIYGIPVIGRTWNEFLYTYNYITDFFRTCGNKRHLICFVHNLSYEFQFIRKRLNFIRVFATNKYAPLYAITKEGWDFRCSYRLSSLSLDVLAKKGLTQHTIRKLTGYLDYTKIRHSFTPLTIDEIQYCINDVKVVNAYTVECINAEHGRIDAIPLTNTGYVRRDCRNACFNQRGFKFLMMDCELSPEIFNMCRNAFMGGFVHSNPQHTFKNMKNVCHKDISSSYFTQMMAEKFPMGKAKHANIVSWSQLHNYMNHYCCIFTVTFKNLMARYHFDYYISASKCEIYGKRKLSNGRVIFADELTTTITELDFDIIEYMYEINKDNTFVSDFIYFEKDYLPSAFIKTVLNAYIHKTELKGDESAIELYNKSKRTVNGAYGMIAYNPIKPTYIYENGEWQEPIEPELRNAIHEYNINRNRFLYYPWAVYVTAYARHAIWSAIIACGDDYIYSDTDSCKFIHPELHEPFFIDYNKKILQKLERACKIQGININGIYPRDKKGKIRPLGIFVDEGISAIFKTIGAKRYLHVEKYDKDDASSVISRLHMVTSGVKSKTALPYLWEKCEHNVAKLFDMFDEDLIIPSEYAGKNVHTYIDTMREGEITDYMGNTAHYCELSAIHLSQSDYDFSRVADFKKFILQLERELFQL